MPQKYKAEDFVNVLSYDSPKAIARIWREVGCSRDVAAKWLLELERTGRVKRIDVDGGSPAYLRGE